GELCIGGPAVARGYIGRPALTAEKFIPNPFSPVPGARMYRSGDRVRWRADGVLEFVGRLDFQVKIRGFRIEPGEVEAALRAHPAVRDAVALVREDAQGRRLVAYVLAEAEGVTAAEMRTYLKSRLPEYMVPSPVMVMDAFPLNANGKVDRRALPEPELGPDEKDIVAPRTQAEELLAGIFAELLGAARVGIDDDFFALGGHSLLATRLISRVRHAFGVEVPLRALFEAPTVAALAARIEAMAQDAEMQAPPLVPAARTADLPLSFAQQRLWFIDQLEPGSAAYNMPFALRLRGRLDADALQRSLTELARRHETLRTRFATVDDEPVQVIDPPAEVPLARADFAHLPREQADAALRELGAAEATRPFDLAAGPLMRCTLARLGDEEHALFFTLHHIVSDGWSMGILVREVSALYAAFSRGEPSPLADLAVQYADFAAWQRAWLSGDVLDAQLGWWRERLAGAPPVIDLPTDRPRTTAAGSRAGSFPLAVSEATTRRLRALTRQEGATLFMTLLAAWQLLLSKYAGQDDVTVGTPVAGRTRLETEGLIGFFVNTLVLRTDLSGDPTIRELLARVRETTLGAHQHQDVPFEKLVEELVPERSLRHTPLFQVMFALQNNAQEALQLGDLQAEGIGAANDLAKFDLMLGMTEQGERIAGTLSYRADLFDAATIERLAGHFSRLLDAIVEDADRRVSAIALVDGEERERLLAWSGAAETEPAKTIHALFAEQAARTPDAVAIVAGAESMTYAELDAASNRLAHHLRGLGVRAGVSVALCMERTLDLPIALLGILKAGGTYVPLDLGYPAERLAFMAGDAGVRVLLTQSHLADDLAGLGAAVVRIDADRAEIDRHPSDGPESDAGPDDVAYVMYTSGSTGTPKGTEVPHCAVPGFFRGVDYVSWDASQVHLQHASLSWDVLTLELWPALLTGARCVMYPGRASEPVMLGEQVREHGVTMLWLSAAYFNLVIDTCPEILAGVKQVMTGGEA
ncbi:MAG: AMP-binding protein, partial [Gemmatimonadetes bacterium]|nr:AMP-binding protein [Gemmatimonadota bacterium]